ncbi:hypothetical protein ABEB36_002423 [Hypothenemus hampei]|uniref:Lymphoid-specific helicase n=1 Tax=Hypothenemus hampei TaxID=57062 RepID=A0ABD1F5N5_HYPHA
MMEQSDSTDEVTSEQIRSKLLRDEELLREKRLRREEKERSLMAEKKEAALAQMKYLLSVCEQYSDIFKKAITESQSLSSNRKSKKPKSPYLTSLNDLENIKQDLKAPTSVPYDDIINNLDYLEGGTLHPYQIEGVKWMFMLYANGSNGILADEMGLGKTVQIIALICVLLKLKIPGPFLIVAPLSTIPNWLNEFKKFAPKIPVVSVTGSYANRREQIKKIGKKYTITSDYKSEPVVLVTFQTPLYENLSIFKWKYIIIDEGQRIKNPECLLGKQLRKYRSDNRLILTGTPLQNNIKEMWTLLNFILPECFTNMNTLTDLIFPPDLNDANKIIEEEQSHNLITKLRNVLKPFMLRRLKKDCLPLLVPKKEITLYCPMTQQQLDLYMAIIDRNMSTLLRIPPDDVLVEGEPRPKRRCTHGKIYHFKEYISEKSFLDALAAESAQMNNVVQTTSDEKDPILTNVKMISPLMMFRKAVNHPYLIHFPTDPESTQRKLLIDENLVQSSGKMKVLDALLPELKKRKHKVLLFSQFTMLLDIIEDYLLMREYNYRRLDGAFNIDDRAENIDDFNNDPNVFIFIISTRAGGLGLNLMAADTVIFFDRDWNPQVDIQAQDRCHRIGQTRPVVVYTLTTKNTVDDHIINTSKLKRILEKVIISSNQFKSIIPEEKMSIEDAFEELRRALQKPTEDCYIFSNKLELKKVLDRSDLYAKMKTKLKSRKGKEN